YEVLQYLVEGATDVLGDTCIVYLAEEGSATLRVAAEHFRDEGSAARHRAIRYEELTRSDTGLVGAAFESGQTQFVADYGTDPRARPPFVEVLQSVIVAPLVAGGQVLGALVTYTSPGSSRRFTTEEVSVADALASRAAQAFERAQLWASAEAERAKLEAVFEQMADGLLIFSADGKPRVINPAGERLLGLTSSDEVTLAEYMRRLEPASLEGLPLPAEAIPPLQALRGEVVTSTRLSVATARGERLELTMSAAPLRDGRGQIAGAVSVFRDAAPLREAERAKDQFLSIASHELKTPLTSLKGFAQLLQRALLQPDQIDRARAIRYSESVLRQSDRLAELVNDLLDVSRIQSGRLELDRRLTDLARLAGDVLDRCRGQSTSTSGRSGRQHEFVLDVPPEPLTGCWDESRLDQVLTNLVTNAIKYSPDGGEIRVRLWREDDEARVSVSDQGIGIPNDQFEGLFLPFARARNAQAQHFSGFGLGLYISRDIALRHGGRLWVASVEGEGSTFYLALPLTQAIGPDGEGSESDPFREGDRCDVAPARRAES
ncbi:MAG: GAF domain-containing protein, partial [Chloroflexi bacterium]|nr:GAF domain-containing protein [Chloroflexota bacterium]